MTECRRQLTFDFYEDKHLVADFKGGQISSDTGLLAVRQLDEKLGWLCSTASTTNTCTCHCWSSSAQAACCWACA